MVFDLRGRGVDFLAAWYSLLFESCACLIVTVTVTHACSGRSSLCYPGDGKKRPLLYCVNWKRLWK